MLVQVGQIWWRSADPTLAETGRSRTTSFQTQSKFAKVYSKRSYVVENSNKIGKVRHNFGQNNPNLVEVCQGLPQSVIVDRNRVQQQQMTAQIGPCLADVDPNSSELPEGSLRDLARDAA